MNYRQWKKNYKKSHGYNPHLEEDKREKNKQYKSIINKLDVVEIANQLNESMRKACEYIADAFDRMASIFRGGTKC